MRQIWGMTPDPMIVHLLSEAHALETALGQALASVDGDEAAFARPRIERIEARLDDLGDQRRGRRQAYAVAQTALGQLAAAGRGPIDRLLGGGVDARALRAARDAIGAEAYAIGTYAALEALATDAGDHATAALAREHHDAHDRLLFDLRARVPALARSAAAAATDVGEPSDLVRAATERARQAAEEVRALLPQEPDRDPEPPASPPATDLPIPGYARLRVGEVLPLLAGLSAEELEQIESYERTHRSRRRVLDEIKRRRESGP